MNMQDLCLSCPASGTRTIEVNLKMTSSMHTGCTIRRACTRKTRAGRKIYRNEPSDFHLEHDNKHQSAMSPVDEKGNSNNYGSSSSYLEQRDKHLQPNEPQPSSTNNEANNNNNDTAPPHRLAFLPWLTTHFTFSWFTCTQSTGGIATLLSSTPKTFPGLHQIGLTIFLLNILLFTLFTLLLLLRFHHRPSTLRKAFTTPPECYFFGSFWLTLATMIINMERYGTRHLASIGPWLTIAIRLLFWLYAAMSLSSATVHLVIIAKFVEMKVVEFPSPAFILILNAMLTGTAAGAIAQGQPVEHRVPIMVAGVAYQGLGWIMCMIFLTFVVGNLLEKGWPVVDLRGGLFIMVGTTGFTIVALIGCARAAPADYGYFATHPIAGEVLLIVATWTGIFLWLFSLFVFGVAFLIIMAGLFAKEDGKWRIGMSWNNASWALIFPNVGWVLGTIYLGEELQSEAIAWVSVAMIIALVAVWLLDLFLMSKAVVRSMFIDSRIKVS
ncbi:Malic acid transport protein [Cercospora zeina]